MTRTWFITGTSSGFGRLMTEKLLARGDKVAATLRKKGSLDDLKEQYGDKLWIAHLDVTDTAAIYAVVKGAFDAFGRIDVIVNNAGYGLFGAAEEVNDDQIRHQIDTNVIGSIQTIRAALPLLRAQGGGRIIQVSSEGGQIAYPNFSLYHASKWAIEGFVESVSQEVAPFNIDFTLAEPGPTMTNFAAGLVSPPKMDVYENTPAGDVRNMIASGEFEIRGDASKMAQAMIDSVDVNPAPKRLTMGAVAYASIHHALTQRLQELESQKDLAISMDRD
ncbi:SDR family oxidoreductase [Thalassospira xiamenensis]|uniref:NADP-dependent 3-hydroxy acid dehydrogenase YdfG n=1 Tax=Thalassospira xiamenensis TaxID=220697 RepID=A0A285R6E0_9PROT|nr:SDR family oxidoreductase [Thalassospira xiamenensis]SOB89338.1 NADP-dependent 3-hydroxy acid dehydrogenase YdfG [Thalassospira xiamenensis]